MKINRLSIPYFFLITGIVLCIGTEVGKRYFEKQPSEIVQQATLALNELCTETKNAIHAIPELKSEKEIHEYFIHHGFARKGISFFIFQNGRIIKWSDNRPALTESSADSIQDGKVIQLTNGLFIPFVNEAKEGRIIGLVRIRHDYSYENKYLQNEFNPSLGLPISYAPAIGKNGIPFTGPDKSVLFYVQAEPEEDGNLGIPGALYLIAGFFLLLGIFHSGLFFFKRSVWFGCIFLFITIALRVAMIYFKVPNELYASDLFSPENYASSFIFNSPGDLLLNAIFILMSSFLIYVYLSEKEPRKSKSKFKFPLVVAFVLILSGVHVLLYGLVINSRISFDLNDLSSINVYTGLGLFCMALLFTGVFLLIAAAIRYFYGYVWSYQMIMVALFISSVYTSITIWQLNQKKENETRLLLAQKIDVRQDHIAEYVFDDTRKKIVADSVILKMMKQSNPDQDSISSRIISIYFNDYLGKFDVAMYLFDRSGSPVDKSGKYPPLSAFLQQAQEEGRPTYSDNLVYLPDASGKISYLAILSMGDSANFSGTIVLQMNAKFFQGNEGFPELFIANKYVESSGPGEYSFARYAKGALVYEFGNYIYSFSSSVFGNSFTEPVFYNLDGYNHLLYPVSATALVVVSRPQENQLYMLTLFSWIFTFFSVTLFLLYLINQLIRGKRYLHFTLKRRIQVSVLILVILSFVLIGTGTVVYIFTKYESDQKRSISEQVNGLWFLIGSNIGMEEKLSLVQQDEMLPELNNLVRNLNIDFNLFDDSGKLFFSSQPKIYDQGIVARRMNPEALFELNETGKTQFINPERAGKLKFLSAYAPLTDHLGNITGYLNLPYFEKQNELNREISGFLSALMNIYVLLFGLAVVVTLLISSRITQPLLLIQEKLSGIRLGKRNEYIDYAREDEIGQLVKEYNRMIDELTESSAKLAQSERESAWREMAKQVAHEIKNPLTPMKLSVQHLRQAWRENRADKEEMMERMTNTLIQQIETLSNIATEFSNFAVMPATKNVEVNLNEMLSDIVRLFDESPEVNIQFNPDPGNTTVIADKDQVIRIFSNLLKNAIQSIPATKKGLINVKIQQEKPNYVRVSVSDNGIGIPEDQRDKIFTPNFTTKSSGMGLGLAMVKNIVENSGGNVWFSSVYNQGTTFYVLLPKAK